MFYTLIKQGGFDQSEGAQGPIYVMNSFKTSFCVCHKDTEQIKKYSSTEKLMKGCKNSVTNRKTPGVLLQYCAIPDKVGPLSN